MTTCSDSCSDPSRLTCKETENTSVPVDASKHYMQTCYSTKHTHTKGFRKVARLSQEKPGVQKASGKHGICTFLKFCTVRFQEAQPENSTEKLVFDEKQRGAVFKGPTATFGNGDMGMTKGLAKTKDRLHCLAAVQVPIRMAAYITHTQVTYRLGSFVSFSRRRLSTLVPWSLEPVTRSRLPGFLLYLTFTSFAK